ncbi:MAG: fatty acid desaturase [Pseudomonadota bacterium]
MGHTPHRHTAAGTVFPGDNPELLRALQTKPDVAWPTVALFTGGWIVVILLGALTLYLHWLPVLTGAVLAGITGYFLFSPIHDALHRSVSRHEWINDLIAIGTVNLMLPYSSHKLLRWGHMQHHRHTNEPGRDPDKFLTGHWHAPLTAWPFFELFYVPDYWQHRHKRPRGEVVQVFAQLVLGFALLAFMTWWQGIDFFLYWLVASRTTLWLIVAVFVYLPHQPFSVLQKDAPYQATLLRQGREWLLTPLMACQNWHLVHHLYPNVPFYRYKQVWLAREAFHESHRPARVAAFRLLPETAGTTPATGQ